MRPFVRIQDWRSQRAALLTSQSHPVASVLFTTVKSSEPAQHLSRFEHQMPRFLPHRFDAATPFGQFISQQLTLQKQGFSPRMLRGRGNPNLVRTPQEFPELGVHTVKTIAHDLAITEKIVISSTPFKLVFSLKTVSNRATARRKES